MSTWYLDPVSGNDATTATPYGWWSIAYTAGSGTQPPNVAAGVAGTACSKGAASAYINYCTVTSGTWAGGDAAGTLYFYGKSGTFTAGTLTITSATCTIGGDLTYCAWQTITSGATSTRIAAGDTIAIAKSPTPYSIGTAAWTSNTNKGGALPATLAITGTASGTGGVVRLTVSATGTFSNGMVVQVVGVTGTVEANGTWIVSVYDSTHLELTGSVYSHAWVSGGTVQNVTAKAVVLSTPQTANINTGAALNVAWTAANSSTVTLVAATSSKIASGASKIAKTSPSTNTLYAYQATGTLNLSSYQNISFSILNNTAILANNWKICLCSDTAGATPVNTFNIPAIPLTSNFVMLNLPSGGNLGSSIKSIALYSGSSAATTAGITLGNFIACTSSGLNLTSLISTNPNEQTTTGTPEGWFGIQSIDPTGTIILLDNTVTTASVGGAGYFGTTQSATTYARETIKTTMLASIGNVQTFQKSGTVGNNISYIGGYNPVTNLQTGETFFDGQNGVGEGFYTNSLSYLTIDRLNGVRYTDGFEIYASSFITILNLSVSNNSTNGLLINSSVDCQINNVLYANNNGTYGVQYSSANVCTINNIYNANGNGTSVYWNYCYGSTLLHLGNACNGSNAVTFSNATNNYIGTVDNISYNTSTGFYFYTSLNNTINVVTLDSYNGSGSGKAVYLQGSSGNYINSLTTTGNDVVFNNDIGLNYVNNFHWTESTILANANQYAGSRIFSTNEAGTANNNSAYYDFGVVKTGSTSDGTSWVIYPQNVKQNYLYPGSVLIGTFKVQANWSYILYCTVQQTDASNIGSQIYLKGGQVTGVPNDLTSVCPADTSTHVLSIPFTPTASGTVNIYAQAWWIANGTTYSAAFWDIGTTGRKYGYNYFADLATTQSFNYLLKYDTAVVNPFITVSNQATVHAYTGIVINDSTKTINLTADHTLQQLYDYTQDYLFLNPTVLSFFSTSNGTDYVSTYNIVNNNNLTGGGSINVGSNTFTQNGAYDGIIITSANRVVHAIESGLSAGSTLSIYNTTGSASLFANTVAGTSKDLLYTYTSDINISIDLKKYTYQPINYTSSITNIGQSHAFSQVADPFITVSNPATVAAYSGISINHGTQTVTLSADHTLQQLYDYAQYDLALTANVRKTQWFTTTNGTDYTSTYNIVNNNNLTGGGSVNVGSQTFTNNGTYNGIIITASNRIVHAIESGLVSGSALSIYNTSGSASLYANTVTGTSLDLLYTYTSDINISIDLKDYTYIPINYTSSITNIGQSHTFAQVSDPYITVTNPTIVGAYTGISINHGTQTMTISANHTTKEIYDYAQWDLAQVANVRKAQWYSTSNGTDYISTYNIVNNNAITGGGTINVGSNTFTENGTYDGTVITSSNSQTHITVSNLIAGSRVQIYDVTSSTELFNNIVAGTSYDLPVTWTTNHTIRLRAKDTTSSFAYLMFETTGTLTQLGLAFTANQVIDPIYAENNIDGSSVTSCSVSGGTIRIYIDDPTNNTITLQTIYNWYQYILFTSNGIANQSTSYFYAVSNVDYRFDPSMKIINQDLVNPLQITGANLLPTSGVASIIDNSNGASTVLLAYFLGANGANLANLDAPISAVIGTVIAST